MGSKQSKQPRDLDRLLINFRDFANFPVESIPELLPEANMAGMKVPTDLSLDAKYGLEAAERNAKRGNYGIMPINDTCDATSGLIYVNIILQEVVVLNGHGILGPEEEWKPLSDFVQFRLKS